MSEVLALKYRPQTFEEVIGQATTVQQLKAALANGNLGHALIFAGTRGSGKTTTARIVAKELNQKYRASTDNWDALAAMVVTEIDAASNTGVDNVREIIENIRYSVRGHRVIILDEAHMLSKNAFNALLKTLEEPPPDVTFILCTTEPHKLIPTVKSRCQIYEFQDISVEELTSHYCKIVEEENRKQPGTFRFKDGVDSIRQIALRAEGSVRDGLSLLQKYVSGDDVVDNSKLYFDLVGAVYSGDVTTALSLVGEVRKTEEARVIVQTLEKWFHWASLETFGNRTPIRQFFDGQGVKFDLAHLQKLFDACIDTERALNSTPNSKAVLEMGIIRMSL